MDKFWLEKAHKYIIEHNAFEEVSDIVYYDDEAIIEAVVSIGLPSRFISAGITNIGVKSREYVQFVFSKLFPLEAPKIFLRDDFPRCFPHINPSKIKVNPCIFEGNLSELLQQTEWMNGVLNQLVDWLEKAAANDLLNYEQGWEPMRNDECSGVMVYDIDEMLNAYVKRNSNILISSISYEERRNTIVAGNLCNNKKKKSAHALCFLTNEIIDKYLPNSIVTLSNLYEYANSIGLSNVKDVIEQNDLANLNEDKLFVILSIKRPVNIIGSDKNIEFINFVIHKAKPRKKKKRTLPGCRVDMLTHIADKSPALMKRLSGTQTKLDESKSIALVGCGSLGSKIGIHLVRNGNGPFLCIDDDIFMPHNNARHALTNPGTQNKAELLSLSMFSISGIKAQSAKESAFNIDYSNSRIIIDTTAFLSVRHFLMSNAELPPIISAGLFNHGQYGILFIENNDKTSSLLELWAYLYFQSLENIKLRKTLFSSQEDHTLIGQSCSSQTMIVDDSKISLFAATMSMIIQNKLETKLPEHGTIYLLKFDGNYSLVTDILTIHQNTDIQMLSKKEWSVSLFKNVYEEMRKLMEQKSPVETGGVLLGSVFMQAKKIVITGLISAPSDSIEQESLFVLGTDGLEKEIKKVERNTNGKVTYLGTWHSHPKGGDASQTDNKTYEKLLFVRNYEPTVCLIVTPDEVLVV